MNQYYQILGLAPGATQVEIKRAYRKLALKYHPDKNKSAGARDQFIRITKAYEILTNPPKVGPQQVTTDYAQRAAEERQKRAAEMKKREFRMRYAAYKRKKELEQNRAYSQGITILISIVLLIFAAYFGASYYVDWKVNQNPAEIIGKVTNYKNNSFRIEYQVNGKKYFEDISGNRSRYILCTPNGMPVIVGAEFLVKYNKENPEWCKIDYELITPNTLQLYINHVRYPVSAQYQLDESDQRIRCLALQTFNNFGIDGLSNLYFWDEAMVENFSNNSSTYSSMVETNTFKKIIEDCLLAEENAAN